MERKIPKQKRAERTVDELAEATIQVLDQPDPKFTTNHVAERAGFAVATLYRYFPDKNALLRFLVKREAERVSTRVLTIIDMSNAPTAHALIEEVVAESLTIFESRSRSSHNVRALVQQDDDLAADIDKIRLRTARRLHDRLREIEPTRFTEISDTKLNAMAEAMKVATLALERAHEDRAIDLSARTALVLAVIESV